MTKKQIHETAITLLNGSLSRTRNSIDRCSSYDTIDFNLREIQAQADFALALHIISEDEHQELKEKWYEIRELVKILEESE